MPHFCVDAMKQLHCTDESQTLPKNSRYIKQKRTHSAASAAIQGPRGAKARHPNKNRAAQTRIAGWARRRIVGRVADCSRNSRTGTGRR
jgi:hypothetical protein